MTGDEVVDLTEEQLRAASPLKWGAAAPGEVAAWVAETDFALAAPLREALLQAVRDGVTGYPPDDATSGLGEAFAGFAARTLDWDVEPGWVVSCVDVMSGIRLVLDELAPPGPVVVPTPAYPPFLQIAALCGRERVDLPLDPDAEQARVDLDALDSAFASGARVLLLCTPHNPWGRVFSRSELEAVAAVADRHGAFVVADEIHAPLAYPDHRFVPYLTVGDQRHAVALHSASKAFDVAGTKCAQIVSTDDAMLRRLRALPLVANHSVSPLGVVATLAAYRDGDAFLASLRSRVASAATHFARLLADLLPAARHRPMEGTYLAWVDLRAVAPERPADLLRQRAGLVVNAGEAFGPGGSGHVRINLATSTARLEEIARRMEAAL